jgi:hypothetical protein
VGESKIWSRSNPCYVLSDCSSPVLEKLLELLALLLLELCRAGVALEGEIQARRNVLQLADELFWAGVLI